MSLVLVQVFLLELNGCGELRSARLRKLPIISRAAKRLFMGKLLVEGGHRAIEIQGGLTLMIRDIHRRMMVWLVLLVLGILKVLIDRHEAACSY